MARIFISYRREDSADVAGRIFDRLVHRFGKDAVFRDIDSIEPGADFAQVIAERIGACEALVVLIGRKWLEVADAQGRRRLDLAGDLVKAEIAQALARDKRVIPVLVENTAMPAREALPTEVAPLADRNALAVSDARFDHDVGRLIEALDEGLACESPGFSNEGKRRIARFWGWPSRVGTPRTLALFGAAVATVATAAWTVYLQFATPAPPTPPDEAPGVAATHAGVAAGGDVSATAAAGGVAVVAAGPVTIGITLEQYEERLRKREHELREQLETESRRASRAERDRIALLERQLAAAQAQRRSPQEALENYRALLAGAAERLAQLTREVAPAQLESALQALAQGDTAQAEALFAKVLEQDKQSAAEAACQLGKLAESRIDYAAADRYFSEAVALEPGNPKYLAAAGSIARTLGRYDEAEPLLEQSLELRKRALGAGHPDVAQSLNDLGELYRAQGRYAEAESLYRQALEIRKKALGAGHPDVAQSLDSLAKLCHAQGRYAEAEPLYRQSLEIRKKALGDDHPDVAASLNNLAGLYYNQGRYAEAEPLLEQSLAISKKALGDDHPHVATGLGNLAMLYYNQGRYAEAEPLYGQSLEARKQVLGDDHPEVAAGLHNLALLYRAQGRYDEAESLLEQSLEIRRNALGDDHPEVAASLHHLAMLYQYQGRYVEAEPLLRQALEISKKALGDEHPRVAASLNNLALLYRIQRRYAEAEPLLRQALEISKKALGDGHPRVAAMSEDYAALLTVLGRGKKAFDPEVPANEISEGQ